MASLSLASSIPHLTKPPTTTTTPTRRDNKSPSFLRLICPKTDVSFLRRRTPHFGQSPFLCQSELSSNIAPLTSAAYGLLLLSGGLFAYSKSQSKGSLFGGLTGAALMGIAYRLMLIPETKPIGDALAFGSALLFAAVFGIRLASTRKIMPGGVLLGVSVGALAVFYSAYLQDKI